MAKKKVDAEPEEDDAGESADGHTPIRIADHPRARNAIARSRAWASLIGFGLGAFFGDRAGVPFVDLVLRSIGIGIGAYLAVWAGALAIWRQILFAELAVRRREANESQQALLAELESQAGPGGGGSAPPGQSGYPGQL
ncbi:MAG: hypothetical protein Q7T55_12180 [Solirubrobacteraceae bacterium]|nr:hypothetical protein [Solirubrobacteraceae bacterium]